MPRTSTPPLPREIVADPGHEAIRARLGAVARPLWSGGRVPAPVLPLRPALATALGAAHRDGHLVLGLERAGEVLAAETRGLALLAQRAGTAAAARVSRLLLVSGDGAERLYRHGERLVIAHAPRVLVVMLSTDAATLGRTTTGREAPVKVVLAQRKHTVAALLRALTP